MLFSFLKLTSFLFKRAQIRAREESGRCGGKSFRVFPEKEHE
jgi:hypothetical protein